MRTKNRPRIISLFSGAGGLDLGFRMAGFETAVMVEYDHSCCQTLARNLPGIPIVEGDLSKISTEAILEAGKLMPLESALVIGGPPCQSFSLAGKRMGLDDPRGRLVLEFLRVVRETLPVGFVMENVRGLTNWNGGKALEAILEEASVPIEYQGKQYSYEVSYKVLDAADFGVPQHRERLFIVGDRNGKAFEFPEGEFGDSNAGMVLFDVSPKKPFKTVRESICGLPPANSPSEVANRIAGTIAKRREDFGF